MTTSPERREQVAAFFAAHADRLRRTVARRGRTSDQVIDDACATAWTILLRRPDITLDGHGFSWLATIATREAWQQQSHHTQEVLVGTFEPDPREHDDENLRELHDPLAVDTETQALDRIQHATDVDALRALKPREREALYLKALGYSYDEIGQLTGSSYTAVNRRITEGRRALRRGSEPAR